MGKNNHFITFEGGEGVGKSTVATLVIKKLEKDFSNNVFFLSREPGGNNLKFSEKIRNLIFESENIDPLTEAFLFQASRREHVVKILKPALDANKIVICDRFIDSSIIYQGIARGVDVSTIKILNKIATDNLIPGLTFIFDLDPIIGQERIQNSFTHKNNHFDKEEIHFHQKVRQAYLDLAKTDLEKYQIIDASKPISAIVDEIAAIIKKRI